MEPEYKTIIGQKLDGRIQFELPPGAYVIKAGDAEFSIEVSERTVTSPKKYYPKEVTGTDWLR